MIARILVLLAAIAGLAAAPAGAQTLIRQYKPKEVVTLDPGTAYILYRSDEKVDIRFLRTPDEADWVDYRAQRAQALAKATRTYAAAMASYDRNQDYQQKRGQARPTKPVEPTDETLNFPSIELLNLFDVVGGRALTKEPEYTYLVAVRPGIYTLYGQIGLSGTGVCLCMGSVSFDAPAGVVTDIGEISLEGTAVVMAGVLYIPEPGMKQQVIPRNAATWLPPQVSGLTVQSAEFHAAPKMPNYFGLMIDRVQPIKGVISYQRDTIVDDRTGQPLPKQIVTAR